MHIPDSMISPATSMAMGAAMVPVWAVAGHRLRTALSTRQVPLLAVGSAFCFTVMMFNIPVLGGTTVHAVGAVLLAVLLGPWAAAIGVTVALVIQALFFGDGGVIAAGANCFTMALAMPFVGYLTYRAVLGSRPAAPSRQMLAAAIGGYVGVNVAALLTAILLGIQPALAHDAAGRGLYFPFDLQVTIPAIMLPHLAIGGLVEAGVTAAVVRYLIAAGIPLHAAVAVGAAAPQRSRWEMVWIGLAALVALSPLGLLASGEAWGEWSKEELAKRASYMPSAFEKIEDHGWKGFGLLPDYLSDRGAVFYVLSAVAGVGIIGVITFALGRILARRDVRRPPTNGGGGPPAPGGGARPDPGGLPGWLTEPRQADPPETGARRVAGAWADRTLCGIAQSSQDVLFAERWARLPGLLQGLDARVKLIGMMAVVLATTASREAVWLSVMVGVSLVLAIASRVPIGFLLKRAWLAAGVFTVAIAAPLALNIATPGPEAVLVWREPYLALTWTGIVSGALLAARVGCALMWVLLVSVTTPWNDLLRGARALMAPRIFVMVMVMTYRYLAVLAQAAIDLVVALRSRTVGRSTSRDGRGTSGALIGALFGKTIVLSEDVHDAMLARGWTGEVRCLARPSVRARDALFLIVVMGLALAPLMAKAIALR